MNTIADQSDVFIDSHVDAINSVSFSTDGQYLASGSSDFTIKIWETEGWSLVHDIGGLSFGVNSIAFDRNGGYLVSGSDHREIKIWNTLDWSDFDTVVGHDDTISQIQFSPSGRYLASVSRDNRTKIWDTSDWTIVESLESQFEPYSVALNSDYLVTGLFDDFILSAITSVDPLTSMTVTS